MQDHKIKVKYQRRFVTHLDILGYRQLIRESEKKERRLLDILSVLHTLEHDKSCASRLSKHLESTAGQEDGFVRFSTFLDAIVISTPDSEVGLYTNLLVTAAQCMGMIEKGILIRGGMTIGNVFHDEKHVLGGGFIEAYELQEYVARYPRVVVSRSVCERIRKYAKRNNTRPDCFLRQDFDALHHVDCLRIATAEKILSKPIDEVLSNIKEQLVRKFDHEFPADVYLKIGWYCSYFNNFLASAKTDLSPIPISDVYCSAYTD